MARRTPAAPRPTHALEPLEGRTLLTVGTWDNAPASAIAYDAVNDKTWVAYYNTDPGSNPAAPKTPRVSVQYKVGAGPWVAVEDVRNEVASADFGAYLSIALDANNVPGIAYFDGHNADLEYARFNTAENRFDVATRVDHLYTVGAYPSLAYPAAGNAANAAISYYYDKGDALKVAAFNAATGTWSTTVVDYDTAPTDAAVEDFGRFSSLKYNPNTGRWAVAYERTGNATAGGQAKFAEQTSSGWIRQVVQNNPDGGGYTSLAYRDNGDGTHDPAFAFYNSNPADLFYARRPAATTGAWAVTRIAGDASNAVTGSVGLYNTLYFKNGKAQIVSYKKTAPGTLFRFDENAAWAPTALVSGAVGAAAVEKPSGEILFTAVDAAGTLTLRTSRYGASFGLAAAAQFTPGRAAGTASFGGKLWLFGGNTGTAPLNDLYVSDDGRTWTPVAQFGATAADLPTPRYNPVLVTSTDGTHMTLMGDGDQTVYTTTDTNFADGLTWSKIADQNSPAPLPADHSRYAVTAFNSSLYLTGGFDMTYGPSRNHAESVVYRSTDHGASWTLIQANAGFGTLYEHAAVAFNDQLWVLGGYWNSRNGSLSRAVYSSPDGINWTFVGYGGWSARSNPEVGVADGRLWLIGGGGHNDVWFTADGQSWHCSVASTATPGADQFTRRSDHAVVVGFDDELLVVGGSVGGDEVWITEKTPHRTLNPNRDAPNPRVPLLWPPTPNPPPNRFFNSLATHH